MIKINADKQIELRSIQVEDAHELFLVIKENQHYLKKWINWVEFIVKEEDLTRIIETWHNSSVRSEGIHLGVFYQSKIIGMLDFLYIDTMNGKTELACWLSEKYQGRGIMSIATQALVDYSFRELGLHRVEIRAAVENIKSRAIPERLGFVKEGILRHVECLNERYHDHAVYSILEDEWLSGSNK